MKARHEFESDEAYKKYQREYFAAMAMQGLLSGANIKMAAQDLADQSVRCADALITQLNKQTP